MCQSTKLCPCPACLCKYLGLDPQLASLSFLPVAAVAVHKQLVTSDEIAKLVHDAVGQTDVNPAAFFVASLQMLLRQKGHLTAVQPMIITHSVFTTEAPTTPPPTQTEGPPEIFKDSGWFSRFVSSSRN